MLLLGNLEKGLDPALTFKKWANQNISGPSLRHPFDKKNTLTISTCALPFYENLFISIIRNLVFDKNRLLNFQNLVQSISSFSP